MYRFTICIKQYIEYTRQMSSKKVLIARFVIICECYEIQWLIKEYWFKIWFLRGWERQKRGISACNSVFTTRSGCRPKKRSGAGELKEARSRTSSEEYQPTSHITFIANSSHRAIGILYYPSFGPSPAHA